MMKIDNREHELIKHCNALIEADPLYKGIQIVIESLPVGDIILFQDNQEALIIERKSWNDLAASIKDGRYEEQGYRLQGLSHPNHNIIYLLEGDIEKRVADKKMLYSAMFSLQYHKGFSLLRSSNIKESAHLLCHMAHKLKKTDEKRGYYSTLSDISDISSSHVTTPYCNVVKKVKKENITPQNIGEIMLCQIPGISAVTATAIMKHFGTLPALLHCMKENSKCLLPISYLNSKGQERKLNKTVVNNMFTFLLSDTVTDTLIDKS